MNYEHISIWAQVFTTLITLGIVILTFIQSKTNKKTLEEMRLSRIKSVSPHLVPSLDKIKKGFADGETSYIFDMKVIIDLNKDKEQTRKIHIPFDIAFHNSGKGPAYNLEVIKFNDIPIKDSEKNIRIINPGEQQQIQFNLYLINEKNVRIINEIHIRFEDSFGNIYEQDIGLEIGEAFFQVNDVFPTRAKLIEQ